MSFRHLLRSGAPSLGRSLYVYSLVPLFGNVGGLNLICLPKF
jgi:hypothetical protein